ncbi:MAG: Pr6Pr family membrane protein [Devosia sp.]
MPLSRIAALAGFVIGLAALILQFSLTVPLRLANGDSLVGAVIFYFTFFTILTNLALVLIYLSDLVVGIRLGWFRSPVTRGMMTAAITLVMLFYHFVLAGLWAPEGWFKVADVALHYVTPGLYILWWLIFPPHGTLRFRDIPWMLMPPLVYLIHAMIRGAIVAEYPYPILDAHKLGYPQVALNILLVLAGLVLLCAVAVGIDRLLGRTKAAATY